MACILGLGIVSVAGFAAIDHQAARGVRPEPAGRAVAAAMSPAAFVRGPFDGTLAASSGLCVAARSLRAARTAFVRPFVAHGAPKPFDAATIAAFLHTAARPPALHGKQGRPNTAVTLALSRLDADGIAEDRPAAAPAQTEVTTVPKAAAAAKDVPSEQTLAFDTGLGQIKTSARAGVMNDQPAAALNVALTRGPVLISAAGMSEMTNLSEPGGFRKTFKLSTKASIPLD